MDLTPAMQVQARAIADPTRFAIFGHIVESDRAVVVQELTDLLGFNHNAIRQHLAVLVEADLIDESDQPRAGRGRPRKQYRARADALSAFGAVSGSYQRLAGLLLRVAATDAGAFAVGFEAATDAARGDAENLLEDLVTRLAIEGFAPRIIDGAAIELGNCPFADVAAEEPSLVCELHRGLLAGHVAAVDRHVGVDLVAKDPHDAGCRVVLESSRANG